MDENPHLMFHEWGNQTQWTCQTMNSLLEDHLTSSSFGRLKQPSRNRCRLLVCGIYASRRGAASLGDCSVEYLNRPIVKLVCHE